MKDGAREGMEMNGTPSSAVHCKAKPGSRAGTRRFRRRRPFTPQYKLSLVERADACETPGEIGRQHGGAFLCDGVGLGKTFVGLMLIERLILHEGKRVALFAPKATKEGVWEPHLRRWLSHIGGVGGGADFSNLAVFSHTDLGRKGDFPERFKRIAELADVVVIDEAHHFRNPGRWGDPDRGIEPSRYSRLFELLDNAKRPKTVIMLTATPINNRLTVDTNEQALVQAAAAPLAAPSAAVAGLVAASIAENTKRTYSAALEGQDLTDASLAVYLASLHAAGLSPAVASMAVASVKFRCRLQGLASPVGPATDRVLAGLRREGKGRGQVDGVRFSEVDTAAAVAANDGGSVAGLRDAALLAVAS